MYLTFFSIFSTEYSIELSKLRFHLPNFVVQFYLENIPIKVLLLFKKLHVCELHCTETSFFASPNKFNEKSCMMCKCMVYDVNLRAIANFIHGHSVKRIYFSVSLPTTRTNRCRWTIGA